MSDEKMGWHRRIGYEVSWKRVGFGIEFSFGAWWPREWSVFLILGPLMAWVGIEDCDEVCRTNNHFRGAP